MRTKMTLALLSILLIAAVPTAASAGKGSPVQGKPQTCPKGKTGWDAKGLVGKRLPKAKRIAARHGCSIRVLYIGCKGLAATDDYVTNRINVAIRGEKRRVVRVLGVH